MRKVIYSMMISLDGFFEGSDHNLDWPIIDEELHSFANDRQSDGIDTYLYGRRMYDVMRYWETAEENPESSDYEREFARVWKEIPKIVFSKTLDQVEGNSRLVRGNIAETVSTLKAQPGKDMAMGGANLAASVARLGLIDEYQIYIHPVILGQGNPFLPAPEKTINLQLIDTRTFGSGVVYLRYKRIDKA
ncbi:MAG: dihydrofolate reductase [Anaerolineaceae bacterium]|nr:dihydrofolate reductase [Anaerolineaceae bacterium]MCB9099120.1 dihydrofolate reductase [Anaerolineales bacterium]